MRIEEYSVDFATHILRRLTRERLFYGSEMSYESLLSTCLPILGAEDVQAVDEDFGKLWQLYDSWSKLYQNLKAQDREHWLVKCCCSGLTQTEVEIQDRVIEAGQVPRYGRTDYICLGERRKIAEVQWRSGGPGLLVGICEVIADELRLHSEIAFDEFSFAREFARVFRMAPTPALHDQYVVVNDISASLQAGEQFLTRHSAFSGMRYLPIVRDVLEGHLRLIDGRLHCEDSGKWLRVDFVHGYDFYKLLSNEMLAACVEGVLNGELWFESPLNFIYRQKWGMALPFMKEFRECFDDRTRAILCPTVLLNLAKPDFAPLGEAVDAAGATGLSEVSTIDELLALPRAIRERLVLKCGSGQGPYHTKSRGVFRLDGTRNHTARILELVRDRMNTLSEPWILQPYVDEKVNIPFVAPTDLYTPFRLRAHSRYLIYGSKLPGSDDARMIGGLANYGRYWKVNGRSNSKNENLKMWGSSFVPLVAAPGTLLGGVGE